MDRRTSVALIIFVSLEFVFLSIQLSLSLASSPPHPPKGTAIEKGRQLFFSGKSSSQVVIIEEEDDQQNHGFDIKSNDPNVILSSASALYSPASPLQSSSSFIEWLDDHSSSNPSILGTEKRKIKQVSKDIFHCTQPSISWFGVHLVPIFVSQISRRSRSISQPPTMVAARDKKDVSGDKGDSNNIDHDHEYIIRVQVKESKTDFGPQMANKKGKKISLIKRLMEGSDFGAVNVIKCRRLSDTSKNNDYRRSRIWEVTSDFSLEVTVPLPNSRFILLPPGFNTIGSRIIRRTARKRSEEALQEFKDDYLNWSSSRNRNDK